MAAYGLLTTFTVTATTGIAKVKRRRGLTTGPKGFSSIKKAAKGKATVVVIDDDASVLGALSRLIRAAGYRVRAFSRPDLALISRIPRHNACVIADIFLPEMNGVELCNALARAGTELPYILITGRTDAAAHRLIEKSRALAVLFKPVDEVPLLKAISRAVAMSRENPIRK